MAVKRFGVSLEGPLLKEFDKLIKRKGYANRSQAIRDLIRDLLVREAWEAGRGEVAGTITIVYRHDAYGITKKLTEIQHKFLGKIVSSLHVHLDENHCLEVVVARGPADEIRKIADTLISAKGVLHGGMVATGIAD
ncbi:MAG TPA: nickel-responsive transcriptional regulator NikR [Armatimonadetes bacterium]|nr:nickel-responsive transcriptional regulator NikR [Armatimonadota bacterium]